MTCFGTLGATSFESNTGKTGPHVRCRVFALDVEHPFRPAPIRLKDTTLTGPTPGTYVPSDIAITLVG